MILLASASPRRRDLLLEHGYEARVVPAEIEEVIPGYLTVAEITLLNAKRKAQHVARSVPDELVLGADTLVTFGGAIFGKPRHLDEAFAMVSRLSGRTHEVITGVWLVRGGRSKAFTEMSRVRFRKLTPTQIRRYLDRIGPLDKAGGYAAQTDGGEVIESIEGSRSNVIGLPMESLAKALQDFEIPPLAPLTVLR